MPRASSKNAKARSSACTHECTWHDELDQGKTISGPSMQDATCLIEASLVLVGELAPEEIIVVMRVAELVMLIDGHVMHLQLDKDSSLWPTRIANCEDEIVENVSD